MRAPGRPRPGRRRRRRSSSTSRPRPWSGTVRPGRCRRRRCRGSRGAPRSRSSARSRAPGSRRGSASGRWGSAADRSPASREVLTREAPGGRVAPSPRPPAAGSRPDGGWPDPWEACRAGPAARRCGPVAPPGRLPCRLRHPPRAVPGGPDSVMPPAPSADGWEGPLACPAGSLFAHSAPPRRAR